MEIRQSVDKKYLLAVPLDKLPILHFPCNPTSSHSSYTMAESEKSSQMPVDNNTTTILATGDTCTLDQSDSHKAPPVFGSLAMLATCVSLMAT